MTTLTIDRRRFMQVFACGCAMGAAGGIGGLLEACGSSTAPHSSAAPALPRVHVRAYDYRFDAPTQVPAGLVEVELENLGQSPHALNISKIKEGVTYEQIAAAKMKGPGQSVALQDAILGGTDFVGTAPGGRQVVHIFFDQGKYILESNASGNDGIYDMMKGMLAPIDVVTAPTGNPPSLPLKVLLTDTGPQLPAGISHGTQIWEVTANSAAHRLHTLSVARLAPGKKVADWLTWRKQPTGSSPIQELTGVNTLGQGDRSAWLPIELPPGDYVAYCSIVLPKVKQDHIANGEVIGFTVA
jgi:hypothetical protein